MGAMQERAPAPALRRFVRLVWASDAAPGRAVPATAIVRERVLPSGLMHVVFRLAGPLRLFASVDDPLGVTVADAIVGGARASFYLKDASSPAYSVGASLAPGAAARLFGVPASALSERHTPLELLWGREEVQRISERLHAARSAEARMRLLEAALLERALRGHAALHPVVRGALGVLEHAPDAPIGDLVARSGYSHRAFTALFRDAVGLTPKVFGRVLRFQRACAALLAPASRAAEVAASLGFSDQPHLVRELRSFAGLSPGAYRSARPAHPNHVPDAAPER